MNLPPDYTSGRSSYWLGWDDQSGRPYAVTPWTIGKFDYDGFYELSDDQYAHYLDDPVAALVFVEECQRHEHDDLLRFSWRRHPGTTRGS